MKKVYSPQRNAHTHTVTTCQHMLPRHTHLHTLPRHTVTHATAHAVPTRATVRLYPLLQHTRMTYASPEGYSVYHQILKNHSQRRRSLHASSPTPPYLHLLCWRIGNTQFNLLHIIKVRVPNKVRHGAKERAKIGVQRVQKIKSSYGSIHLWIWSNNVLGH